jgi:hypothetical protein
MNRWTAQRGIDPWAAALAGVIMPLTGSVFPHMYARHLSNLLHHGLGAVDLPGPGSMDVASG